MMAGWGRRLGDTAGGFLSPRQGLRRCQQHGEMLPCCQGSAAGTGPHPALPV